MADGGGGADILAALQSGLPLTAGSWGPVVGSGRTVADMSRDWLRERPSDRERAILDSSAYVDEGGKIVLTGEGWAYSNIGYLKVAQIIQRTSNLALGDALDELVFRPAEATTAKLAGTPQDLADVQMGEARGYHPGWVYHGLVTGTTADAALLLHALMSGALLRPETVALMIQGRALPEHRSALHSDPAYGLGLMQSAQNPLDHPIGHAGSGPGSKIAVYALNRRTCAIWEATSQSADLVIEKVFERLATGG